MVEYVREGEALTQTHLLDEAHTMTFRAESIRLERTGVHALVAIAMNGVTITYDSINVEKDADRTHLSGRVGKFMKNGLAAIYPPDYLQKDIDLFCYGLWSAQVGQDVCELAGGFTQATPAVQVVRDLAIEDAGTIVFGPPERGKSWMLMLMAVSLDAGVSDIFDVVQRRTLFINLERSRQSVLNRLGLINRALGLPPERPIHIMNARGKGLEQIYSAIQQSVSDNGIEYICMDSLSRAGLGDLNDNVTGNKAVDKMNGLARGWTALAHSPRNDDSHIYGSIMQEAGADVMVKAVCEKRGLDLGIGLYRTKGSDLPPATTPQVISLGFDMDGLCEVRRSKVSEWPEILLAQAGDSKAQKVKEYIREVGQSTATEVSRATGVDRSTVAKLLLNSDLYVKLPKTGKEQPYGLGLES